MAGGVESPHSSSKKGRRIATEVLQAGVLQYCTCATATHHRFSASMICCNRVIEFIEMLHVLCKLLASRLMYCRQVCCSILLQSP